MFSWFITPIYLGTFILLNTIQINTNLVCPPNSYYQFSTNKCEVCQPNNIICANQKTNQNDRQLQMTSCSSVPNCIACITTPAFSCYLCEDKFYLANSLTCTACSNTNCQSCSDNTANCLSCIDGYSYSPNTCTICSANCIKCSSQYGCVACNTSLNYYVNFNTKLCQLMNSLSPISNCLIYKDHNNYPQCTYCSTNSYMVSNGLICQLCTTVHPYCLQCPSSSVCTNCGIYFQPYSNNNKTTCKQICGDKYALTSQCDQPIGGLFDGCSDICTIQKDFICTKDALSLSSCTYTSSIDLIQISVVKAQYLSNSVTVGMQMYPKGVSTVLQSTNLASIITINGTQLFQSVIYSINPYTTPELSITFNYLQKIQGLSISLTVTPLASSLPIFSTSTPSTSTIIFSNPNYALSYYPTAYYSICKMLGYLIIIILIFSIIAFILCIAVKSIVGLQLVLILQYFYASLLFYPQLLPPLYGVSMFLGGITGLNIKSTPVYRNDFQTYFLNLSNPFSANYNVMIFIIFSLPLLFTIIFKIIKHFREKAKTPAIELMGGKIKIQPFDLQYYSQFCRFQLIFILGMFNFPYYLMVMIIFYTNPSAISSDAVGVLLSILVGGFTGYGMFLFFMNPLRYSFILKAFDKSSEQSTGTFHRYFMIYMIGGIVIPILVYAQTPKQYFIPFILQIILGVTVLVLKPYKGLHNNIRSAIFIFILSLVSLIRIMSQAINNPAIVLMLVIIVQILLIVAIIYTLRTAFLQFKQQYYFKPRKLKAMIGILVEEEAKANLNNNDTLEVKLADYQHLKKIIDDKIPLWDNSDINPSHSLLDKRAILTQAKKETLSIQDQLEQQSSAQRCIERKPKINIIDDQQQEKDPNNSNDANSNVENQFNVTDNDKKKIAQRQNLYLRVKNALVFQDKYGKDIENHYVNEYQDI